jgi:hypothetical protein
MHWKHLRRGVLVAVIAISTLTLVACGGDRLSGVYTDPNGIPLHSLEFKPGGKVYITMAMTGTTSQGTYKQDGDKIIVEVKGGGNLVLTLNKDGSLTSGNGPMSNTFRKQP